MDPTRIWQKDPDSTLSAGLWWQDVIERGDTLSSITWTVPTGLTKVSEGISTTALIDNGTTYAAGEVAVVRISGGTAGMNYTITCTATTASGDVDQRSVIVSCIQR